jgi:hypothetical protein
LDGLTAKNVDDPEIMLLERRLNAMESVRDEYSDYRDGK